MNWFGPDPRDLFFEDMGSDKCLNCGFRGDQHVLKRGDLHCPKQAQMSDADVERIVRIVLERLSQ